LWVGKVDLLSFLLEGRLSAACATYEDEFWISGGVNWDAQILRTVEGYSFR
jgi:hypothetical protein